MREKKKIIASIILTIIICTFATVSYGFQLHELTGTQTEVETLKKAGNNIVSVVLTIGTVVSVVMLIVLGIKYMMGSVSEKAEYKKTLMPYVIGASLVFAASSIAQLIYSLAIKL
ncbi:MAG: TrbC/VirB2 family protein [Clostridia bacterium]|nr:TrbC/VirB2 family protein [Clostridia bacterium]